MGTIAVRLESDRAEEPPVEARGWRWIHTSYFAEGLVSAVVTVVAAVLFKRLGASNQTVTLLVGGLVLPWSLKPLWSPFLEVAGTKRLLVVLTEGLIATSLLGIAVGLSSPNPLLPCLVLLLVIAVGGATHDTAVDGLFVSTLGAEERARHVGWLSVSFWAAKLTAQGLLLIVAGSLTPDGAPRFGWRVVFCALAALAGALAVCHFRTLPRGGGDQRPGSSSGMVSTAAAVVSSFLRRSKWAWPVALIVLYRVAEGQCLRVAQVFLIDTRSNGGLGLSTAAFGTLYGALGPLAFIGGALIGGRVASRLGLKRSLLGLCVAFHVPAVVYFLLAWQRPRSLVVVGAAIVIEQVVYGVGSVGLTLVMMLAADDGSYPMSHFALATGISSVGSAITGMSSGWFQEQVGYSAFFGWTIGVAAPALFAAFMCSKRLGGASPHAD